MTVLIIGGAYQGKLAYAQSLPGFGGAVTDGAAADKAAFAAARCVNNLHRFVRKMLEEDITAAEITEFILTHADGKILICDDICAGIVPMDKTETLWREATGRLLCELVRRADAVVRMQCGLAQVLKGALPC